MKTKNSTTVSALIPGHCLTNLYKKLDDEARPFEATVKKDAGGRRIEIKTAEADADYFQNLLNDVANEVKV